MTHSIAPLGADTTPQIDASLREKWGRPCVNVSRAGMRDLNPPVDAAALANGVRAALRRHAIRWASPQPPAPFPRACA